MQCVSKGCPSEPPVLGTHRLALRHGFPTGLGTPRWKHLAAGWCRLAASPGVQRWVPRTPRALGAGKDPGKGLLLVQAQGLPWGRGPSNLPGKSRGAPSLPRAAQGRGFSHAAGSPEQPAGKDAGSTGCGAEQQPFPRDVNGHCAAKPVAIALPAGPSPPAAPRH